MFVGASMMESIENNFRERSMHVTKFKMLCDFCWVFQAFLRGKLLRQNAYRPKYGIFSLPVSATVKRVTMLIRWWGLRLPTLGETRAAIKWLEQRDDPFRVPVSRYAERWGNQYYPPLRTHR